VKLVSAGTYVDGLATSPAAAVSAVSTVTVCRTQLEPLQTCSPYELPSVSSQNWLPFAGPVGAVSCAVSSARSTSARTI